MATKAATLTTNTHRYLWLADIPSVLATRIWRINVVRPLNALLTHRHAKEVHRSTNAGRNEWVVVRWQFLFHPMLISIANWHF